MGDVMLVFIALAAVFWIYQFASMMNMKDEEFIGRHDKLIWSAAFIVTLILGALAFWWWKACRTRSREENKMIEQISRTVDQVRKLGEEQK